MAEVELAGVAEDEVEPDGQHHVDGADDQVGAPIGVLNTSGKSAMTMAARSATSADALLFAETRRRRAMVLR